MKILFVYDHKYPEFWRDGLWAALNLLEKQGFEIKKVNLFEEPNFVDLTPTNNDKWFVLGWGAFNSKVDNVIRAPNRFLGMKKGLCLAGYSPPPYGTTMNYNIIFYEVEWALKWFQPYLAQFPYNKTQFIHAFGINSDIYKVIPDSIKIWDWVTVGAFANWKRQYLLINKGGYRLAIGEIQKENLDESIDIVGDLLVEGISVSDMVSPEKLAMIYNSADKTFIGADVNGGGERATLESLACGTPVEVEKDNPKLQELLIWKERGRVPDHFWYADQLGKGIKSCF
jgi:hypothetical protein